MRNKLIDKKSELIKRIQVLESKNHKLIKKNNSMLSGNISKNDFLNSGHISYKDKIIFIKGKEKKRSRKNVEISSEDEFGAHLRNMRVFWLIFSCLSLVLYFSMTFRRKKNLTAESSYD